VTRRLGGVAVAPVVAFLAAVTGLAVVSALALAQDAQPSQYKIRVVDRKRVFDEYDKTRQALKALEEQRDRKQALIDRQIEAVQVKEQEFEGRKNLMTDEERRNLADEILKLRQACQQEADRLQQELNLDQAKLIRKSRREIDEVIAAIGNEESCHLILEIDPKSQTSVIYYNTTIDITEKVVGRLNGSG